MQELLFDVQDAGFQCVKALDTRETNGLRNPDLGFDTAGVTVEGREEPGFQILIRLAKGVEDPDLDCREFLVDFFAGNWRLALWHPVDPGWPRGAGGFACP